MTGYVTLALIAITVVVSWQAFEKPRLLNRWVLWPPAVDRQGQYDRLLTSGFVHADWWHLIFNMVTLYSFGPAMESHLASRITEIGYLVFYLSAVVVAILPSYVRHRQDASYRSLGASGAVSAVLFGFILLDPWAGIYLFLIPVAIPAFLFAGLYLAYTAWMDKRGGDNINHSAHLWGALYGVGFTLALNPELAVRFVRRLASPGSF
ncbi:MAG: rhomboid family intramembrane serine protease [Lysobacteraceae bacterium]